ncbi:NUDIX domain-containing protein [Actinacidiphila alni]|uniref:NUDIX domain-containing protein n=1 Tax=Actinacidiphila alni TaxID=380248 RepID=UPI0034525736
MDSSRRRPPRPSAQQNRSAGRAPRPSNASVLIHNDDGEYLLHLRDMKPDIWALLGGGIDPQDSSLEDTVRRELKEEAELDLQDLEPLSVEAAVSPDGLSVPVHDRNQGMITRDNPPCRWGASTSTTTSSSPPERQAGAPVLTSTWPTGGGVRRPQHRCSRKSPHFSE